MPSNKPLGFDPIIEARRQWVEHGWPVAADGMAAVTSVMRAQQVLIAEVDQVLEPFELTFARYELLVLLLFSRRGALPLGKIGARLQVHPASVTNAVDRLETQRLVARRPHPTDGRTILAAITARGRRTAQDATAALNDAVFAALGLSPHDLEDLFRVLRKLRIRAGDFATT